MIKIIDVKQKTIANEVVFDGINIINWMPCRMRIMPHKIDGWIVFCVNGITQKIWIETIDFNVEWHTTNLIIGWNKVYTVEHLLSAIAWLDLDNLIIVLEQDQIPFVDWSAIGFCNTLLSAKIIEQEGYKKDILIHDTICIKDESWCSIVAAPSEKTSIFASISFNNIIWEQTFEYTNDYIWQIAWCKTFLVSEIDGPNDLKRQRIRTKFRIQTNSLHESPITVYNKDKFYTPRVFSNEEVRHKILDFIGDSFLLGYKIIAKFTLNKPSHKLNRQFIQFISSQLPWNQII